MDVDSSTNWWRPPGQPQPQTRARETGSAPGFDLGFWALIAFTTIMLLAPQERFPVLAPLRLALLSVGVAILACAYDRITRRLPIIETSPDVILLLLLTGWAILTLPFSVWPGGSFAELTDLFLKSVICFLLLSHAITSERQLWGISWCLALCALPISLTAISNYGAGVFIEHAAGRVLGYNAGLTGNPNDMALMLNLMLPLCVALLIGSRKLLTKLFLGALIGLIVAAIILTFSRAGFVMLVIIGALYAWRLRKRPQRTWIPLALILGLASLPLVPADFYGRINTIVNYEEDPTHSAQTRLEDMKTALQVTISNPIKGAGIGMSALALNEVRGETWKVVHNLYLQVAVDLGLVGLLLYGLLMVQCVGLTGKILRNQDSDPSNDRLLLITEALRVSLLAFTVAVMFYPVAYNFYFFYFGGLAVAAGRIARQETDGGGAS
jgi:probable O-glycosylation ligase (exosortase A-associated)